MKRFLFLILLFTSITHTNASIMAEGDCDTIKYTGGMPSFQGNLYNFISTVSNCRAYSFVGPMLPHLSLQKYDYDNSTWSTVSGPQTLYYFVVNGSSTGHGTYRLLAELPTILLSIGCGEHEEGPILIYNFLNQWVGYAGYYSGSYYSNSVIVGETIPDDIKYSFIDIPETGSEFGYDFGENPLMDVSTCKNFDLWWLAIFESGPTYNRYVSNGWTYSTPTAPIDIGAIWTGAGYAFEVNHAYTMQFAIENSSCINSSWNNYDRFFYICPFGTGCRFGSDNEIVFAPNPANSFIKLMNFVPDLGKDYQLWVSDCLGRQIDRIPVSSGEVDVSNLQNGVFTMSLIQDNEPIFVTRVVITH